MNNKKGEKEIINLAVQAAKENGYGAIIKEKLQDELNKLSKGEVEVTGNGPFTVTYKESGRTYNVEQNGNTSEVGNSNEYGPTIKINDKYAAQLMFVIGTDGGGLEHPNWKQNLKMAIKIQEKADEMYPGLFRPIIVRNSRYNQHVTNGAVIIEVGATGNTMQQCILSMQCLANVLEKVCK